MSRHPGHGIRHLRALSRSGGQPGTSLRSRRPVLAPARFLQRSIVKVSYARNRRSPAWSAHGRYLARASAQRTQEHGRGFDAEGEGIHLGQRLERWQRQGDPRLWKVIVSPERSAHLDLRAHARELADRIERDLGRRLEWVAIDHHDTAHPHVHLLIRGIDREGRDLLLHRSYIQLGLRRRSQELATLALGLRQEREQSRTRGELVRDHGRSPDLERLRHGLERERVRERTP